MPSKTVNLNIRTDKELKESVGRILEQLGLNHSTVVNMLYRQINIQKAIPFPVGIPNKATRAAIEELESKKDLKTYSTADELFNDSKA